jgi:hypothetical protein
LTRKNVTTLYLPPYSPELSPPDCFLFPNLKMKLKGLHFADVAKIQEAVNDELKKLQTEEFSAAFQKLYDSANSYIYMPMEIIFNKNKVMCLPHVFSIFQQIRPKTFGPHCVGFRIRRDFLEESSGS